MAMCVASHPGATSNSLALFFLVPLNRCTILPSSFYFPSNYINKKEKKKKCLWYLNLGCITANISVQFYLWNVRFTFMGLLNACLF